MSNLHKTNWRFKKIIRQKTEQHRQTTMERAKEKSNLHRNEIVEFGSSEVFAAIALVNSRWLYSMVDVCLVFIHTYTEQIGTICATPARIHFMIINQYGKPFCCSVCCCIQRFINGSHFLSTQTNIFFCFRVAFLS